MIRIRVLDTETTGLGYGAKVVECGYHDLVNTGTGWKVDRVHSMVFNVHKEGVRCEAEAQRIHGIQDDEIESGWEYHLLPLFIVQGAPDVYCAHNMQFDGRFFNLDKPSICTLKCAKYLWKNAPSYKNGELGVWKGISDDARLHRVIPDTRVTAGLLKLMLEEDGKTPEQLVQITGGKLQGAASGYQPIIVNFGIHRGKSLPACPTHWLQWVVNESQCRDDFKEACSKELSKRNG